MNQVELAIAGARFAPLFLPDSVFVELGDARVAVTVGDEEIAVGKEAQAGGLVECVCGFIIANGFTSIGYDHLQTALAVEFHDGVAFHVDQPDIAIGIDLNAVGGDDGDFGPGLEHGSVAIEFDDGVSAAVEHPDVVELIDGDSGHLAEVPTFGEIGPIFDDFHWQFGASGQLGEQGCGEGAEKNDILDHRLTIADGGVQCQWTSF